MGSTLDAGAPDILRTVLRVIPLPVELGISSQISSGWLLSKLDQAGAVLPCGVFAAPAMLSELGSITIHSMPRLGDCVTFRAKLIRASADSAEVEIEAVTERRNGIGQVCVHNGPASTRVRSTTLTPCSAPPRSLVAGHIRTFSAL